MSLKKVRLLSDLQSGGNPEGHPGGVWSTPGPPQQADPGPGEGAEGGEVTGGAPRGEQQKPAVRQDEAGGGDRELPETDSGHDG